jgi:hypothetical protein
MNNNPFNLISYSINSADQLSIVGCPVWSILLIMSIPNAESDELVKNNGVNLVALAKLKRST